MISEYRVCPRCKEEKNNAEYYPRTDGHMKRQRYCKTCMKDYNKERYAKYKKRKGDWFF